MYVGELVDQEPVTTAVLVDSTVTNVTESVEDKSNELLENEEYCELLETEDVPVTAELSDVASVVADVDEDVEPNTGVVPDETAYVEAEEPKGAVPESQE